MTRAAQSVAEIVELQRHADIGLAQKRDRFLQVIALFADDPDLVALNLSLNFQFRILDQPRDLPPASASMPCFKITSCLALARLTSGSLTSRQPTSMPRLAMRNFRISSICLS